MKNEMASELNVLAREAARVAQQNPQQADLTHNVLRRAIREVIACFPVYRTYLDADGTFTDEDRRDLTWAIKQARANESDLDPGVFDFLCKVLSGDLVAGSHSGFSRHSVLRFAMKLQQYSGPVMAKGLEDTAFYRYNRFIALNEVGGSPDRFGVSIANFHKANEQRAKFWPNSMLTTSTHDTKRGEDTRARLAVLSEMPEQWSKQMGTWSRLLRARRGDIEGTAPPARDEEYMFYQLLVGTWPAELSDCENMDFAALDRYKQRLKGAMTKSLREAKVNSKWVSPNKAHEEAVLAFVDTALDIRSSRLFCAAFLPFQHQVARLGVRNSLMQTALKLTVPGVPDIYQGAELWDLSMMDPDNRSPVDYPQRVQLLDSLSGATMEDLLEHWQDGAVKLFVTSKILALRAADPELFEKGEYIPLTATGPKADLICAFARRNGDSVVIVIAKRFPFRMEADPGWANTSIAIPQSLTPKGLRCVLTGTWLAARDGEIDIDASLNGLPVAVFAQSPS
jgi:(1->4)-alpha-D-glucan 1-alpha-D-glucosylmutase